MKNNPNQTFKKKEEFRKPFPIKKSQPVGGYHDNHSSGPSRTVPRFPSSRTEGRKPIQCYGCGTPGVVKSKYPTCTRTNEIDTEVNCMTLFNLNSDLYPSSVIVLKIFGEKIAVCADTGASHTIAGEKLFKFLQEHGITFTNKVISFMMADGIRQTITALRTVVDLYIEGKVIPAEFLVLPEAKGNKTLLGLDFLNAAKIVLDVQGGKWHFSENPRKHEKRWLEGQNFGGKVSGGSKLPNETGVNDLWAVVQAGSCSTQIYLLYLLRTKEILGFETTLCN
ncbi:uncharacterized protein TNCT_64261 [Trichonephila clavata]|uniref:Uncharacterized protein n=1 Tax=Trichonephila clavata TaxID=2740835 RepID=A0A8X6LVW4_TRICU|nr:uncharacterized protein TNCT_64261 [Trichonephila clavata]